VRPYLKKQTKSQRTRGLTQVIEYLLSKHEALNSIPSTGKTVPLIPFQIVKNRESNCKASADVTIVVLFILQSHEDPVNMYLQT
jgi:hypothetical protein